MNMLNKHRYQCAFYLVKDLSLNSNGERLVVARSLVEAGSVASLTFGYSSYVIQAFDSTTAVEVTTLNPK